MKNIQIKICGITDSINMIKIVKLKPDYLGFILYRRSERSVSLHNAAILAGNVPDTIKKVGVLVDEPVEQALKIAKSGIFDILQLHGDEDPDYCKKISRQIAVIKAFRISDKLPGCMDEYKPFCEMFLFDTAGKLYGGTGKKFNHELLVRYKGEKEYILSGGVSPGDADYLKSIRTENMACIDLNSRFEIRPGIKNIDLLQSFIEKLRTNDSKY